MIHGIGCDIVNIMRIERVWRKFGNKFIRRILTTNEIDAAKSRVSGNDAFVLFAAKRYAAKEAYAKAVGCGIGALVSFLDVEVLNDVDGNPYFSRVVNLKGLGKVHLSLSDEPPYVISYVVIERVLECT